MSRPTLRNKKINISELLHTNLLKEIFNKEIPTDYKLVKYSNYVAAEFYTNSKTKYDLEFHFVNEDSNTILSNGKTLGETVNSINSEIECIDIAFTVSDAFNKENPDEFEIETNKHETFELFGKLIYIIKKLLKKYNNHNVLIIGGDSRRNRLEIYEFSKYYGKSAWHEGKSIFFIKNTH